MGVQLIHQTLPSEKRDGSRRREKKLIRKPEPRLESGRPPAQAEAKHPAPKHQDFVFA